MNINDIATKQYVLNIMQNVTELLNNLSSQKPALDIKVSTKEAARLIGVHHRTVRNFVERGHIQPVEPTSKSYEFWISEINRYMKERT